MKKIERGYSLLELLLISAAASILLLSLAEVYQWCLKNTIATEYAYDRLHQIILADTQLRYQLNHRDKEQCKDTVLFSVKGYSDYVPISTSLQLAAASDCLEVESCRKISTQYQMVKTYFFIAKNAQDKYFSLYEKIADQNAQRIVPGIENLHLLFGVTDKQSKSINVYQSAVQITDWSKVASVDLELRLSSMMLKPSNLPITWNIYASLQK